MNLIFMLAFLFIVALSVAMDWKILKKEKNSVKTLYALLFTGIAVLFTFKYLHMPVFTPARFFILTVAPWFSSLIGV